MPDSDRMTVKNYLRNSLGDGKWNSFAILCIEAELVQSSNFEDIIADFAAIKARRKLFN